MQNSSNKKEDSTFTYKSKENSSIDLLEGKLEKNPIIKTKDNERIRLEKWKIGRKNFS